MGNNTTEENRSVHQLISEPQIDLSALTEAIKNSWSKETAYCGIWSERVPSLNQCAVTALVVQDYLGGKILRRKMTNDQYHFLNKLPNGTEIDLTSDQFNYIKEKPISEQTTSYGRSHLTRISSVATRYELLKNKVIVYLKINQLPTIPAS